MLRTLILLLSSLALLAQDRYVMWGKDMDVCPKQEQTGSSPFQPVENYTYTTGVNFIPPEQRVDVSRFRVQDESGKYVGVRESLGKPVIVGLWSTHCEPSLFLLGEMAQLYGRRAKFGFEVLATNYDRERWVSIRPFLNQKKIKPMLEGLPIWTPAMGEDGVYTLKAVVPALPAFFLIDRQGRLAVESYGYKAGDLSKYLRILLAESAEGPKPTPPASAPSGRD